MVPLTPIHMLEPELPVSGDVTLFVEKVFTGVKQVPLRSLGWALDPTGLGAYR